MITVYVLSQYSEKYNTIMHNQAAIGLTSMVEGMKDWPPKPGFTDMRRMMSTLSMTYLQ